MSKPIAGLLFGLMADFCGYNLDDLLDGTGIALEDFDYPGNEFLYFIPSKLCTGLFAGSNELCTAPIFGIGNQPYRRACFNHMPDDWQVLIDYLLNQKEIQKCQQ